MIIHLLYFELRILIGKVEKMSIAEVSCPKKSTQITSHKNRWPPNFSHIVELNFGVFDLKLTLMFLVAHQFGCDEFWILNFEHLLLFSSGRRTWKIKTNIWYSKFDTSELPSWATKDISRKNSRPLNFAQNCSWPTLLFAIWLQTISRMRVNNNVTKILITLIYNYSWGKFRQIH